ncbi:MAG TPA: hypothetical protein VK420_19785 [Longimicrobium sp.]|nr:hypothetical protein [Longimicrobium sp.]
MLRAAPIALALAILATSPAHAQAFGPRALEFQGFGASLYHVVPARSEATTGLHLNAYLGRLAPRVRVSPSLTFWATKLHDQEVSQLRQRVEDLCDAGGTPCPGLELGEVDISDLSLDVDARYLVGGPLRVQPYVGLGAGLHLVNGGGDFIDNTFVEEILDAITPGMNAMAGVELPIGRLRVHAEARAVLAGGANWFGAGVGGSIVLPQRRAQPAEGRP